MTASPPPSRVAARARFALGAAASPALLRAAGPALLCAAGLALLAVASSAWAQPSPTALAAAPRIQLPRVGLRAADLAVVVNDDDPASREVGRYYAAARGIAAEQVVHVRFPPGQAVMGFGDFQRVQAALDAEVGPQVQAYALAWTLPYRVECMSVTAAFAFGFDPASYCADSCRTTKASPYFNSASTAPFTDHRLRPAMLLAGGDVESAKRTIDRGLRSDERWPEGKAYLLRTGDAARNVRAASYARVQSLLGRVVPVELIEAGALEGKGDVLFHFTGAAVVAAIATNRFADGAIADHLTSFGGVMPSGGGQTSALEWLSAGATGNYGTTTEPCNFRAKFPDVGVVMARYLGGETLVEAYWKSVLMPGQGVFIGDPLARPFGGLRVTLDDKGTTTVRTRALPPGRYLVEASASALGPFRPVGGLAVTGFGVRQFTLPAGDRRHFRVRAVPVAAAAASAAATASEPASFGASQAASQTPP